MLLNCGAEESWESLGLQGDQTSQFSRKSTLNTHWRDWCWSWAPKPWPPNVKSWLTGNNPDAWNDWRQKEKGVTENEMIGWYHWCNQWTWTWANYQRWGRIEILGVLQSLRSWTVRYHMVTEQYLLQYTWKTNIWVLPVLSYFTFFVLFQN